MKRIVNPPVSEWVCLLFPPATTTRYHGSISHEECAALLGNNDGYYLVRAGLRNPGTYSLSFV